MQLGNNRVVKLGFAEAKELAEAMAIFQDLNFVIQATNQLALLLQKDAPDQVVVRSLFTAALVAYVRCFSSGKRNILDPSIFASLSGEPITCHQQYKDTRDKHIAHSVNPFEEMQVGAILSAQNEDACKVEGVACFTASLITYDEHGVNQLGRLASFAKSHVVDRCKELEKLVLERAQKMDIDELRSCDNLGFVAKGGPVAAATPRKQ